jgi:hypothetical protein
MYRKVLPLLTLSLLASGCAFSGHHCVDDGGCGSCSHVSHLPSRLACGSGCGEVYWDEWLSDPPDCEDPCDDCGYYVGPRSRLLSPLAWCNLWGLRSSPCGDCGTCDACTSCDSCTTGPSACDSPSCGGCADCTSASPHVHEIPNQIEFRNAAPLQAPSPPPNTPTEASHRVRRGRSLISLTSAKLSGRHHKTSSDSRPVGRTE